MRKFCRQSDGAFYPTLGALVDLWRFGARAVDQVIALVTLARLPACLVEIGGELRGYGVKPDSQPWWVELEQPPRAYTPWTLVALFDLAIARSGDDRRHAVVDGPKISHTISTLTGRPVKRRVSRPSAQIVHAGRRLRLSDYGIGRGATSVAHIKTSRLLAGR